MGSFGEFSPPTLHGPNGLLRAPAEFVPRNKRYVIWISEAGRSKGGASTPPAPPASQGPLNSWFLTEKEKCIMNRSWKIIALVLGVLLVNVPQASADLKSVFTAVCRADDDLVVAHAGPSPTTAPVCSVTDGFSNCRDLML